MGFNKKAWVRFFQWSKWLGVAALVGAVSLGYSWRSYSTSQNKRQEVGIAQVGAGATCDDSLYPRCKDGSCPGTKTCKKREKTPTRPAGCKCVAAPVASPSPGVSPSPSAAPKCPAGKACFRILKFNDKNGNGKRDANEASTAKVWKFKYKIGEGGWNELETASKSGLSKKIVVNKGSKITVEEMAKKNWKPTTPKIKIVTLKEAKNYAILFGNHWLGASPSPSPDASVSPQTQASFVIHKFLDANKNGVRETGEEATNRTWEFEYQIDGGEKKSYMIEPGEGEGEKIVVDKGVKVKVSELGQEGWLNTTGAELTKTLYDPKLYTFYFGNYPVGGVSPAASFPPRQPDTGSPTWLTVGAAGLGLVLLTVRLLVKF